MKNKVEKLFIIGVIFFVISLFLFLKYRSRALVEKGVYVVGKVTNITDVENGYIATIKYRFKKKFYTYSYKSLPAINEENVFLLISSNNPKLCSLLVETYVPACLLKGKFMDSSWAGIPSCLNR